ncbi:MAG: hypothetical protein OIF32_03050 [Campylobacterales bacterium]|nr:hypothetical protein [Campylobacterales bacterium]
MKLNLVLAGLTGVLLLVVVNNTMTKTELTEKQREISKEEVELKAVSNLKKKWKTNKIKRQRLESLFSGGKLKDKIEYKKSSKKEFKVLLKGIDKDTLKRLTKKVLENSYIVKTFKVTKIDEFTSDLEVRIEY